MTDNFSIADTSLHYSLRVTNSQFESQEQKEEGGDERVSLASVYINGVHVIAPSQFGNKVSVVQVAVPLLASNKIAIKVLGPIGGEITVEIISGMVGSFTALPRKTYGSAGREDRPATTTFTVPDPAAQFILRVTNVRLATDGDSDKGTGPEKQRSGSNDKKKRDGVGDEDSEGEGRVSRAAIFLNGVEVVTPEQFGSIVSSLEVPVPLKATNDLAVRVEGGPGGKVTVEIAGGVVGLFTVFGAKTYARTENTGQSVVDSFQVLDATAPYVLLVSNGRSADPQVHTGDHENQDQRGGDEDRNEGDDTSNVIISINGTKVVDRDEFHEGVSLLAVPVTLLLSNQIAVKVRGRSGATITIEIVGLETTPPAITAIATPGPNVYGWNNSPVTISFTCADLVSGVAFCPAPVLVSKEGVGQIVTGTVVDNSGNTATASLAVNIDETPPTVVATSSPPANAAGWNNTPVTVSFVCTDSLSGVADCPAPILVSGEGAEEQIAGTALDKAGNQATAIVKLSIDRTPPTVTASLSPAPNVNGWNNSDVTIMYRCSDALSGVATCSPPVVVTKEGANQSFAGSATDVAGNSATASVTVNLEKTPPSITASATPPANAAGWNKSDVTVAFQCGTSISGGVICPPAQIISSEGANQAVTGTVTDRADQSASKTVILNIDKTPPAIVASLSPPPNAAGWNNTSVTVNFSCSDSFSGVASCPAAIPVTAEGAAQVITGTATDVAGNSASLSSTVNIDKTPPTITASVSPQPNAAGWNNTDVVVTFTCADALSGIANCPTPVTVSAEGSAIALSQTASDIAGNTAQSSLTLKIDKTPPVVAISSPAAGAILRTSQAAVAGTASDTLSGIAVVTCNGVSAAVAANGAVNCTPTLVPGTNTLVLAATDVAGNAAASRVSVTFELPPVADAGGSYSGAPGVAITFSAAASTDPDNSPTTFTWDFGDGTSGTGMIVMHAYARPGTYNVSVTLSDLHGGLAKATTTAVIIQPNLPPTANANGPYSGVAGTAITLSGSGSDPDNDPLTFTWAFGDGAFGTGSKVSHVYKLAGTYTATFTVSDGQLSATSTAFVTVAQPNRPPVVSAGGPYSGVTGTPVTFIATGSDPDGDAITFGWDFGDGGSASGANPSHTFTSPGNYTVKVTANDGRGGTTSATANAAIAQANHPPHANPGGPYTGQAKTRILFSGSASSDPDGDTLTYAWDFGDGATGTGVAPNHGYAAPGTYTVTLTVDDGRGAKDSATTSAAISPAATPVNQPPVARPGGPYLGEAGQVVTFNGSASSDPDGDPLTYKWDFGDGGTATSIAPTHIYANAGTFSVSLLVDDGNGNANSAATSAVIASAADHIPPHITLSAPPKVLPGTTITATAMATDNVGVVSVTFDVDGAPSNVVTTSPYQRMITIPTVASPGATINVRATAADAAGNTATAQATLTIVALPETQSPTVTLHAPANAAPGSVIILTATASDAVGVASVIFSSSGAPIATVPAAPFESVFTVPATAAVGSSIQFTARATNFSGNFSDATATTAIVQQAGTPNPPTVSLSAPASVIAGTALNISATATGSNGVSIVSFYVEGELIGASVDSPYSAAFLVPAALAPGSILHIEVRADDYNGNEGRSTAQTMVVAAEPAIVMGQVLDDSSGLLLQGAAVALTGNDATAAAYTQKAATDERGRFEIHAPAGMGLLVITHDGMTRVDRLVNLQSGISLKALDARLTPLAVPAGTLSGVLGGTASSDAGSLTVPPGSASGSVSLTLSGVSQQGIQGSLPPGWSPVSAIDIAPHGTPIPGASLSVPNAMQYAAGSSLVLAKWDETASAWRAMGNALVSADGSSVQGPVDGTGEYAVLAADTQPSSPPQPGAGELLTGSMASLVPPDAMSLVLPKPKVVIYSPGVNSEVTGSFTSNLPLPSGTLLSSTITESYQFFSGAEIHPEPFSADLVAYQSTADGKQQTAIYKVSPSQTFEPLTLQSGVIDVQLLAPTSALAPITTIGSSGGTLTAPTNESIQVPPDAVRDSTALQITGLSAADLGLPMPNGVDFLDAMRLDFVGTLALSARVSVPTPASLGDTTGILLVRLQELQGQTRMVLVGLGEVAGDHIISDFLLAGAPNTFEGVRVAGRYALVHMQALTAFVAGTIFGTDGKPFPNALVTNPTLPIVSLSRGPDGYIAIGPVGVATFTAQDLGRSSQGTSTVTFANPNIVLPLDLHLVEQPPMVVSIVPSDGSTAVSLDTAVLITFSQPIDPNSVTGVNSGNITLTPAGGTAVASSLGLSSGNTVVTLRPNATLQSNTLYTVSVSSGVLNLSGDPLAAPATAKFTSLNTNAPLPPPAGSLSATIPSNGLTTVTATQGTAGVHDTVVIIDLTTGQVTPVLLQPDGSFSTVVAASITDKLQLKISNGSGNDTTVDLPRFTQTNPDGSISAAMDSTGGHLDGPGGTAVDIPADSLPDGTVVSIRPVAEANFPITLTDVQKQVFSYSGGIALDFGGATPAKYVNLSVPAGPNDAATDQWVVGQAVDVGGVQRLNVVDTARVINGRIATSSPPCPGAAAAATYGIYKSHSQVGVAYGQFPPFTVTETTQQFGSYDSFLLPWNLVNGFGSQSAVCLPVLTGNVTLTSNTVQISVTSKDLTPQDREIVIKDSTQGTVYHYPRNVVAYVFNVLGDASDHFQVTITTPDGLTQTLKPKYFDVVQATPGTVNVTLNADKINVSISQVVIADQSVDPVRMDTFTDKLVVLSFSVPGGAADQYAVQAIDIDPSIPPRALSFVLIPPAPPLNSGNLIAKAVTGTIDPASAGRKGVFFGDLDTGLSSGTPCNVSQCIQVPDAQIINGGFTFPFNGDITHRWSITVTYSDGRVDSELLPRYQFVVKNKETGEILSTVAQQAPPRGQPVNIGTIMPNAPPPLITSSPAKTNGFDPSAPLTVTFSDPMDPASLQSGFLVEALLPGQGWVPIDGKVQVSADLLSATFIPATGLQLGTTCRIRFTGVKSADGQELANASSILLTSFKPQGLCPGTASCPVTFVPGIDPLTGQPFNLTDVASWRKQDPATGKVKTYLAAISDQRSDVNLLTYDATDPTNPTQLAQIFSAGRMQRIMVDPNVQFGVQSIGTDAQGNPIAWPCSGVTNSTLTFSGDLAVTTTNNPYFNIVDFWDVTDPTKVCLLGSKPLTASAQVPPISAFGTIHGDGLARRAALLPYPNGLVAYVAVGQIGLMAVDVGKNSPSVAEHDRQLEPYYAGDFQDVVAADNQLLAVEQTAGDPPGSLDLFDASLNQLMSFPLTIAPLCLAYGEGFPVDLNGDGIITPDEVRNVVFVGGYQGSVSTYIETIQFIDVTDPTSPRLLGSIQMPGIVRGISVDVAHRRLYVRGGTSHYDNGNLCVVDVSNLLLSGLITKNGNPNGFDDRIIYRLQYPGVNGFSIDTSLGLVFVASPFLGLDVVPIRDICCDLAVDLKHQHPDGNTNESKDELIRAEQAAILKGLSAGLTASITPCGVDPVAQKVSILEQGSGASIWRGDPDQAGYQPGISDHDFEVFIPQAFFQGTVSHPDSTSDNPLPDVTRAQCLAIVLNDQFTNFSTGEPIKIVVNGNTISFEDISFFPVPKEEFVAAKLGILPPSSAGSDRYGDLGLGRQQLLLKWLLEGVYVPVTLSNGTVVGPAPGEELDSILDKFFTTGIPPLEGLEWGVLQEFNLTKSLGFIRINRADQTDSTFHGLFEKQVHDAGKAGVRAALAQMVAVPSAGWKLLSVSRAEFQNTACVTLAQSDWVRDEGTGDLTLTGCHSFEEYVASQAVRDADEGARYGTTAIFTPDQARQVYGFFQVKADKVQCQMGACPQTSETAAEDFIASVARFISTSPDGLQGSINAVGNIGGAVCDSSKARPGSSGNGVQNDPRTLSAYFNGMCALASSNHQEFLQRFSNLQLASTGITDKRVHGKIDAITEKNAGVHVFNNGSADANGVFVRMFRSSNEISKMKKQVDLKGGHAPGYEQWLDFTIGTKDDLSNPYIDQTSPAAPLPTTFVIDLPERSVKEPDRQNNWDGFYYWILDRSVTTHTIPSFPSPDRLNPNKPQFPLDPTLLTPDPVCAPGPRVEITQTVTNDHVHIIVNNPTDTPLTNVVVCSSLATPPCSAPFNVPAHAQIAKDLPISSASAAATVISTVTATAQDPAGNTVPIAASQVVATISSPFNVQFFDNTPLSASGHPFSRYARSHDLNGNPVAIQGAVTDGTVNAVRIAISGLRPNQSAIVALGDPDLPSVTDGLGQLDQNGALSVTVSADSLGNAVIYYTPPSFFLRPSAQKSDWNKVERAVNVQVHQENVGTTTQPLALRRPPVFLLHGLGGEIDAFDQFQPLVPTLPAEYYVPRPGFDGRFDLINVGSPHASHHIVDEVGFVKTVIAGSLNGDNKIPFHAYLPGFAIGKIDVIAHSMGGLIMRTMTQDPVIAQAVRKLIIMNSPLAGTPLADKVVEIRDQYSNGVFPQLKITPSDLFELVTIPGSTDDLKKTVNVCNVGIKVFGNNGFFNLYNGAVDDLQVSAVSYTNTVPTHHIVTRTGNADIAGIDSGQVWLLWRFLGRFCGWTPDSTTVERTTQLNATSEMIATIVTAGFGVARDGGVVMSVPEQATFLNGIRSIVKSTKGGIFQPTPIFTSDNDRVVPLSSQLEGLTTTDPSVTYVNGLNDVNGQQISSDHQEAKISPGVRVGDCVTVDANGVPQFNIHASGPVDLNGDGTPDPVCHVLRVLEADPKGALFKQP